ncbi:MAG: hypothetical protein NZ899_10360 [Thermoguttaceae bacterium]|nr:hypothetical protein [Thermoguttaceae bacterium]MDW8078192.1 hypothetical protein [Thermoguttaceae bacterium]
MKRIQATGWRAYSRGRIYPKTEAKNWREQTELGTIWGECRQDPRPALDEAFPHPWTLRRQIGSGGLGGTVPGQTIDPLS